MNLYQMSQNLTDLPDYSDLKMRYRFHINVRIEVNRAYLQEGFFYLTKRFTKVLNDN